MNLIISILFAIYFNPVDVQQLTYLNEFEGANCEYKSGIKGICTKIKDCLAEYNNYKINQSVLKVCSYGNTPSDSVICCRNTETRKAPLDLAKFEICRDSFLKYRKNGTNIYAYFRAYGVKKIPNTLKNCKKINEYQKLYNSFEGNFWTSATHGCHINEDGTFYAYGVSPIHGSVVRKGDRPNMAAIGWTQPDRSILYNCGGSIITERFIVTAAHCKFFEKKIADTVRVGDRYLLTEEDDEIAQQLKIKTFINHPNYKSYLYYNDIALIQTIESIVFNNFVVPSCIADLDAEVKGVDTSWTVAGYGETEDGTKANVLLELKVKVVPNSECNKILTDQPELPNGIVDSQLCVESEPDPLNEKGKYPDTCFGDSGSPLQYKTAYEVFSHDFNQTFLSHMYLSSNVVGIVSFGISCGLDIPSVYTKLAYFRDWISSVILANS